MRNFLLILTVIAVFTSCKEVKIIDNNNQFKQGVFEIPAGDGYGKTIITRIDSLQIEEYTKIVSISTDSIVRDRIDKHIDTLYIEWKNNFSYILRMKSPKTALDKDQIFVKINKVTDSSFSFIARIGYSKFKQTGTVYKVKE
jgi:hypothetical protein